MDSLKDFAIFTLLNLVLQQVVGAHCLVIDEVGCVPVPADGGGKTPVGTASHGGAGGVGIEPVIYIIFPII